MIVNLCCLCDMCWFLTCKQFYVVFFCRYKQNLALNNVIRDEKKCFKLILVVISCRCPHRCINRDTKHTHLN